MDTLIPSHNSSRLLSSLVSDRLEVVALDRVLTLPGIVNLDTSSLRYGCSMVYKYCSFKDEVCWPLRSRQLLLVLPSNINGSSFWFSHLPSINLLPRWAQISHTQRFACQWETKRSKSSGWIRPPNMKLSPFGENSINSNVLSQCLFVNSRHWFSGVLLSMII